MYGKSPAGKEVLLVRDGVFVVAEGGGAPSSCTV